MSKRPCRFTASAILFIFSTAFSNAQGGRLPRSSQSRAFPMKEVSAFEESAREDSLIRGQRVECSKEPSPDVKKYPLLVSSNPLYGTATFEKDYSRPGSGKQYHFAIDESQGSGWGYDRLYFDANRDLDLTNDRPVAVMRDAPAGAIPDWRSTKFTCFDYLAIEFDYGPALGVRPFRVFPRLGVRESGSAALCLVSPVARKGRIRIAGQQYSALLGQAYGITGRFDQPYTRLFLDPSLGYWWGAGSLQAMIPVRGKFYTFSTTPLGERLRVIPYEGALGMFEIGPGNRRIHNLTARGSLRSASHTVPVGKTSGGNLWPEAMRRTTLPVGDYLTEYLIVEFGRLSIGLSRNYHSDGHPRDRQVRPLVYGITVRKDRPYVLDFSNPPEVMFASPARGQRFKPGDEVRVEAVLIDPQLDMMIRRLKGQKQKTSGLGELLFSREDTRRESNVESRSLDPTVTVANSKGEIVARGVMPFG